MTKVEYPILLLEIRFRGGAKLDIAPADDIRVEDIMVTKVETPFFRLKDRFSGQSTLIRWDDVMVIREVLWQDPAIISPCHLEAGHYNNGRSQG